MHKQNDYLRRQLHALERGSPERRRKFQLLLIRCAGCGDVLVEVMQTDPYPVIRFRRTTDHPAAPSLPAGAPVAARVERMKTRLEPIRQGAWSFYPIPWPLPEPSADDHGLVPASCRCREVTLTQAAIFADLRAGVRKRTHPMPRHGVT